MIDPRTLTFIWPLLLWSLVLIPLLGLLYVVMVRRQARRTSAYPGLLPPSLKRTGVLGFLGRHGSVMLMLLAVTLLLLAIARPRAMLLMPAPVESVMLVMDASGSMRATDIKPSRIEAAQEAARAFVQNMPGRLQVGVVTVAGTASLAQGPTSDRDALFQAIDNISLQRGSALGSGILIALTTLLPGAGIDAQKIINDASDGGPNRSSAQAAPLGQSPKPSEPPAANAEPGSNRSVAIILLTDGEGNTGPETVAMAELAASHGVRVYTVGVGTPEGVVLTAHGMSARVRLDETVLKRIAEITEAEYFRAGSAGALKQIYQSLSTRLTLERRQITEVTAVLALVGVLVAAFAAVLSMTRIGRIV
jgi:Ca-activated chloride channel family protein